MTETLNAITLLKELRDTTPITAQRKRIDEFLASRGNPLSGKDADAMSNGVGIAAAVGSPSTDTLNPVTLIDEGYSAPKSLRGIASFIRSGAFEPADAKWVADALEKAAEPREIPSGALIELLKSVEPAESQWLSDYHWQTESTERDMDWLLKDKWQKYEASKKQIKDTIAELEVKQREIPSGALIEEIARIIARHVRAEPTEMKHGDGTTYYEGEHVEGVYEAAEAVAKIFPSEIRLTSEDSERERGDHWKAKAFDALEVLRDLVADIEDYEKVNNLYPNPGRKDCWHNVTRAKALLSGDAPKRESGKRSKNKTVCEVWGRSRIAPFTEWRIAGFESEETAKAAIDEWNDEPLPEGQQGLFLFTRMRNSIEGGSS